MKTELYNKELMKKLVTEKELKVLSVVWDDELSVEKKIKKLLED